MKRYNFIIVIIIMGMRPTLANAQIQSAPFHSDLSKEIVISSDMKSVLETIGFYECIMQDYGLENKGGEFETLVKEIDKYIDEGIEASKEKTQVWITQFPEAWCKEVCAQIDITKASEDNPVDVTPLILNADFETGDLRGWKATSTAGDSGAKSAGHDVYKMSQSSGTFLYNTWNGGNVGYALSQNCFLPDGKYELRCVVASNDGAVVIVHAGKEKNRVTCKGGAIGVPVILNFRQQEEGPISIGTESVGVWYKADNFQLFYLGNEQNE